MLVLLLVSSSISRDAFESSKEPSGVPRSPFASPSFPFMFSCSISHPIFFPSLATKSAGTALVTCALWMNQLTLSGNVSLTFARDEISFSESRENKRLISYGTCHARLFDRMRGNRWPVRRESSLPPCTFSSSLLSRVDIACLWLKSTVRSNLLSDLKISRIFHRVPSVDVSLRARPLVHVAANIVKNLRFLKNISVRILIIDTLKKIGHMSDTEITDSRNLYISICKMIFQTYNLQIYKKRFFTNM